MALSHKQLLFIDHYLIHGNASAACISAGYKGKPNTTGSFLLTNLGIKAEITKRQAELAKKNAVTIDSIVADLKTIRDYTIAKAEKSGAMVDTKNALKAVELLGKTIGAFVDKQEVTVTSIKVVRESDDGQIEETVVDGVQ